MTTTPTDDRFGAQWYLLNSGTGQYDLNIVEAWDDYSGAGVSVTVIDVGFDYRHPDLAPNYDTGADRDFGDNDDDALPVGDEHHGTAVIGILGAAANGSGVVGVAHGAALIGFRTDLSLDATREAIDATWDTAHAHYRATDIVSMSFGTNSTFSRASAYLAMVDGFAAGSASGRDGLGTVYVKSAGNTRENSNTNSEMRDASIHTVTVSATLADGSVASYATPGSSVLIAAFGSPPGSGGTIVTTDRVDSTGYNTRSSAAGGDFTDPANGTGFKGTSAATPMVSGIVALMLEANPGLGWRDVQTILAYSARHVGSDVGAAATGHELPSGAAGTVASWFWNGAGNWNGGGLHFSNDYGFGLVDAKAAVRLAESWSLSSTTANQALAETDGVDISVTVPDGGSSAFDFDETANIVIEHVTLDLMMDVDDLGDLELYLTSPAGTTSRLIADVGGDAAMNDRWTFASNAFRGEESAGNWILQVHDDEADGQRITILDADLRSFGAAVAGEHFVFTDEFSEVAGVAGHATTFAGAAGRVNILNAAAVSSGSVVDLAAGSGRIDGVAVTLSGIQKILGGDGNDRLVGNGQVAGMLAGRGNDRVVVGRFMDGDLHDGGAGTDVIDWSGTGAAGLTFKLAAGVAAGPGGALVRMPGFERLIGTASADTIIGGAADDTLDGRSGNDFIRAGSGADLVIGGVGADRILSHAGDDEVRAGGGNDYVASGVGKDFVRGGAGGDEIITGPGSDLAHGEAGHDVIRAGPGGDSVFGGPGADDLAGWDGNDLLVGGSGNDVLRGQAHADRIEGGPGLDQLYGGPGRDSFVFRKGFGIDRVMDFENGPDRFDFRAHAAVDGFADLTLRQAGADVIILDGAGGRVVVVGGDLSQIGPEDFLF